MNKKLKRTIKKGKGNKRAGKISGSSSERKKKALVKINKATVKLKRKQEPCPICFENIKKQDRVETTCGHFFHKKCLQGWCIQKVKEDKDCFCPVCKTDLILQTREAKNKIAEKKRLANKKVDIGRISPGRLQRMAAIDEQGRLETIRRQERREEIRRRGEELREQRRIAREERQRLRAQREAAQNPTENVVQ